MNGEKCQEELIPIIFKEVYRMADKKIVCKDCNSEFIFTEGEQAFYREKGFENDPQRCPECRRARKQQRNANRGNNVRWS